MKGYNIFLIFLGILVLYIILINLFAGFIITSYSNTDDEFLVRLKGQSSGIGVEMGMSDSVSVSVVRNRFYGKIIEYSSENGIISYVYLLGFIKLPLKISRINFAYLHLLVFVFFLVLVFIFEKRKVYKGGFSL